MNTKNNKLVENQRKRQNQIMFDVEYDDHSPFGWYGEIESIIYSKYCVNENSWEEMFRGDIIFNEYGEIYKIETYREDDSKKTVCLKEYDSNGRLIVCKKLDDSGETYVEYRYKYNSIGNLIERVMMNSKNQIMYKSLYVYDQIGRLIQQLKHNIIGGYQYWIAYLYNEDGNVGIKTEIFNNGVLGEIETFSYSKNGNIEHSLFKESFDSFTYYEYDSDGNIIKKVTESHNIESDSDDSKEEMPQIWYEEFEYDKNGNVIAAIEREGSDIVYRHEWIIKYK